MSSTPPLLPRPPDPSCSRARPWSPEWRLGPVIRPSAPSGCPEGRRRTSPRTSARRKQRFVAAAEVVAGSPDRGPAATGVSAEVLSTTAGLARDRGLLSTVEQRIDGGAPAAVATVQAAQQFVDMFTALGGLMAERVTDVRDVRDRIVAELTGQGEPGVPSPDVPSVLLADDLAPADTAGWTRRGSSAWPPGSAARPATPRSSPASSACPASWRSAVWTTSRPG